ncbi:MAG: thioesterase family protein [Bacteroidota bacterium]
MPSSFKYTITVVDSDIDELNHVNNIRYLQWVQDISKAHWYKVVSDEVAAQYVWVVVSHFIEYKASAVLGDTLIAETYVEDFNRHISTRIVEFKNETTGKLIVKAKTRWAMINNSNKRPIAVPREIAALF